MLFLPPVQCKHGVSQWTAGVKVCVCATGARSTRRTRAARPITPRAGRWVEVGGEERRAPGVIVGLRRTHTGRTAKQTHRFNPPLTPSRPALRSAPTRALLCVCNDALRRRSASTTRANERTARPTTRRRRTAATAATASTGAAARARTAGGGASSLSSLFVVCAVFPAPACLPACLPSGV